MKTIRPGKSHNKVMQSTHIVKYFKKVISFCEYFAEIFLINSPRFFASSTFREGVTVPEGGVGLYFRSQDAGGISAYVKKTCLKRQKEVSLKIARFSLT